MKAHISACTCGHLFHEECLFRWFKSSGPNTCPQCRQKQVEKNVIKRLYFNELDIAASQTTNLGEVTAENYEHLQNIVDDLKLNLLELRQTIATKSKFIEEKEAKVKELEKISSNTKKSLSENQLLLDYLKKELEGTNNLKKQYDSREKVISELESKLREYKQIEMIYKDHEQTFANEMNKYLAPVHGKQNNVSHYQSIVRQLVSTNVLLKETADKQMEEKRLIRKKLILSESSKSEKDRKLEKLEIELKSLQDQNDKLLNDNKKVQSEFEGWRKKAQSLLAKRTINTSILQQSISTPTLNKENLIVNDTLQIDDFENSFINTTNEAANNSTKDNNNLMNEHVDENINLQLLEGMEKSPDNRNLLPTQSQLNEEEEDVIEMRCNSMFAKEDNDFFNSPAPKRRKNPFVSYDLNDQDSNSIPTYQQHKEKQPEVLVKSKLLKFKSFNDNLSLSQRFKDSPSDVKIVKPITSNSKRSRFQEIDLSATIMSPQAVPKTAKPESKVNAFSYLSDGFGGRTKVLNKNDKIKPLGGIKLNKKNSFLTKSKVSK